ncbi:BrnT family toxin [Pleomorphomonas diazotrophica]|uniref:BrnT family toxin n=1 Tax=Pleomorphomonas diazotrophica TaxID=1166257 RepID=A0A2N3LRR3_9HYPH|nr:BrnT family toxin [Pleomorphomonas diazotrophica]PKR87362.1 BrnT family toxin [Pleomorphomonas diazotrophica]
MGENETCSWTDAKQDTNISKHGFDFADVEEVFDGRFCVTREDRRFDYGEDRYNMLTEYKGHIINVTFTPRDGKHHLISVRLASREERKVYHGRAKGA